MTKFMSKLKPENIRVEQNHYKGNMPLEFPLDLNVYL